MKILEIRAAIKRLRTTCTARGEILKTRFSRETNTTMCFILHESGLILEHDLLFNILENRGLLKKGEVISEIKRN